MDMASNWVLSKQSTGVQYKAVQVFLLYFKPSIFHCILMRWVRLLGFAIVYGTVTLKMYSWHVLKMLAVIVLMVSWFLPAWTAGVLENMNLTT